MAEGVPYPGLPPADIDASPRAAGIVATSLPIDLSEVHGRHNRASASSKSSLQGNRQTNSLPGVSITTSEDFIFFRKVHNYVLPNIKDNRGEWRWRLESCKPRKLSLFPAESYVRKDSCLHAIGLVRSVIQCPYTRHKQDVTNRSPGWRASIYETPSEPSPLAG